MVEWGCADVEAGMEQIGKEGGMCGERGFEGVGWKGRRLIREHGQALINAALEHFAIPGDAAFPLNQAFEAPRDRQDAETLRQYVLWGSNLRANVSFWLMVGTRYISQVRQELAIRLVARLYAGGSGTPSKVSVGCFVCSRTEGHVLIWCKVVAEFHETEVYGEIIMRRDDSCQNH